MIFKIVAREDWAAACRDGQFLGSAADLRDGFIHFSAATQLRGTASKHFKGIDDLLLVAFDERAFGIELVWEPARDGALFPHLYAPLPTSLALWERSLPLDENGSPVIPEDIAA